MGEGDADPPVAKPRMRGKSAKPGALGALSALKDMLPAASWPLLLAIGVIAVLPIALGIAQMMVHSRWMIQDTTRDFPFMGLTALVFLVVMAIPTLMLTWGNVPWRGFGGLAIWAAFGGFTGGPLILNLLNHTPDAAPQQVELRTVRSLKQQVEIAVVGDAFDGVRFRCPVGKWRAAYQPAAKTTPGRLYRGKLGLLWVELDSP